VFAARNGGKDADRIKEITGTSISTRSSSDFWPELEASLKDLVGTTGGRRSSSTLSPESSPFAPTLASCATCSSFSTRSGRRIEAGHHRAKIVEVELSSAFRAGINWAAIAQQGSRTISGFQTGPQQGFGSNTCSC